VYRIKTLKKAAKVQKGCRARERERERARERIYVNASVYKNLTLVIVLGQMNPFHIPIGEVKVKFADQSSRAV
jgi:hypothetical protein